MRPIVPWPMNTPVASPCFSGCSVLPLAVLVRSWLVDLLLPKAACHTVIVMHGQESECTHPPPVPTAKLRTITLLPRTSHLAPRTSLAQIHPTSLVNPDDPTNLSKFLAPESMRGSGGILLDAQGKRFANELTTRSVLTDAIFEAGTPMPGAKKEEGAEEGAAPTVAYLVLNEEAADAFGTGVLGFYMSECEVTTRVTCIVLCCIEC